MTACITTLSDVDFKIPIREEEIPKVGVSCVSSGMRVGRSQAVLFWSGDILHLSFLGGQKQRWWRNVWCSQTLFTHYRLLAWEIWGLSLWCAWWKRTCVGSKRDTPRSSLHPMCPCSPSLSTGGVRRFGRFLLSLPVLESQMERVPLEDFPDPSQICKWVPEIWWIPV